MNNRLIRFLWGDLTAKEFKRFGLLALIFFVIIGSYWLMRVMKDAQFTLLVGYQNEPIAKIVSVLFVIITLLSYNRLIDLFKKTSLFYFVCIFFGLSFIALGAGISFFSAQITAKTLVTVPNLWPLTSSKLIGWLTYFALESFGSLLPALFWSFVASTVTTDSAKRGYGLILVFGQLGAILGAATTYHFAELGLGKLFILGGAIVMLVPLLVSLYAKITIAYHDMPINNGHTTQPGILEGLRLLVSTPYIAALFVVTTAYEIIGNITEFEMGLCITKVYPAELDGGVGIAAFKSLNGIAIGTLSLAFALLGTSFFMRKFGLKRCLLLFPATIAITILAIFGFYSAGAGVAILVWVFFVAEVIFRGLSYTLNNPVKEIMYIPTSTTVKYKAKSWIDMVGSRAVKGGGSVITGLLGPSLPTLLLFGTAISLGITGFWIAIALYLGNAFNRLQAEKKIIS